MPFIRCRNCAPGLAICLPTYLVLPLLYSKACHFYNEKWNPWKWIWNSPCCSGQQTHSHAFLSAKSQQTLNLYRIENVLDKKQKNTMWESAKLHNVWLRNEYLQGIPCLERKLCIFHDCHRFSDRFHGFQEIQPFLELRWNLPFYQNPHEINFYPLGVSIKLPHFLSGLWNYGEYIAGFYGAS